MTKRNGSPTRRQSRYWNPEKKRGSYIKRWEQIKMKYITAIILSLVLASCSVDGVSGEIVKMPEGYTNDETLQFVQSIINAELYRQIKEEFPNAPQQGRFEYQAIIMKGFNEKGTKSGVITQIYDLEKWERHEEFKSFLESYLKQEIKKPPLL